MVQQDDPSRNAEPDASHTVLVTNHDGLYRYITAHQDAQYDRLISITAVLMVVFFVSCYRQKRRRENTGADRV